MRLDAAAEQPSPERANRERPTRAVSQDCTCSEYSAATTRRLDWCVEQHGHAVDRRERVGNSPGQDASREIVDQRHDVR
jgi:hypothetical protein